MTSDDAQTYPQYGQTISENIFFENYWTTCQHNISCIIRSHDFISYDMISYDMISYDII